jgi:predicted acyl esterase
VLAVAFVASALAAPSCPGAPITGVFEGQIPCTDQGPEMDHIRYCGGPDTTVPSWDGTPIDVNVALPPKPASGPDGPYPLLMIFHHWGATEVSANRMREWAADGYVVFSMTARGWGDSCGLWDPKHVTPQCDKGYTHFMDTRYEVRDAQYFAGMLVDAGAVRADRIGATGDSYGGAITMALAALRDRVMRQDGSLIPWTSPAGTPISLAAAQPNITWTDLAYTLAPNGHTLDYVADSPYMRRNRVGVFKRQIFASILDQARAHAYMTPGGDFSANLEAWLDLADAGEPYDDALTRAMIEELTTRHSAYYINPSRPPAPLLIANGWTDDAGPANEAIRLYNRTRTVYPSAAISMFLSDQGHQRAQNKQADGERLQSRRRNWFAYYLKGTGPVPFQGVEALTQTCPETAPSGGPYTAPSWATLAPGEIRHSSAPTRVVNSRGSSAADQAYDPISGGGACATAPSADVPGTGAYRLPAAPSSGYTLMGSPTIVADIHSPGRNSQLAARLLDVAPNGDATLVSRGAYRPEVNTGGAVTRQVFQLHPNGWRFAPGHVAKLELLTADTPFERASDGQETVWVANLELRLPVLQQPQNLGGGIVVASPAPKVLPAGYDLATDFSGARTTRAGETAGVKQAKPCKKAKRGKSRAARKRAKGKGCRAKRKRRAGSASSELRQGLLDLPGESLPAGESGGGP